MNHEDLARELADFWLPTLQERDWEGRREVVNEVRAELCEYLPTGEEYESVSASFVAAVIDALGAPPVIRSAQASIYCFSSDQDHWGAAFAWQYVQGEETEDLSKFMETVCKDRRRWPRYLIDMITRIWVRGEALRCRLVDLSRGGARIAAPTGYRALPGPGTPIRVAVPNGNVREAVVVFAGQGRAGLQFSRSEYL
ncbi:PilZ domain-containing protein [Thioalkalivibrio sp. AKL17]|uniref:PilZ domain-containing protein n=1 Tax=Thioalkalivibrio sp. AKL17 TaxID=1158160 RepID=UPI000378D4FF|nr:PilZ domain-containing protein [Thioalkalivibrio sp. AKL17]